MPPDPSAGDLTVPLHRWQELVRLAAVMGYPPSEHVRAAAIQAVLESDAPALDYDYSDVAVTPAGAIIRRRRERGKPAQ